jgi:hypothetical protein
VVQGADADVDSVVVSDIEILFCVESRSPPAPGEPSQPRACFRFDRTISKYAAIPVTPRPPGGQPERVDGAWAQAAEGVLRICEPGRPACQEVARYSADAGTPEVAADRPGRRYLACQACSTLEVRERSGAVAFSVQPWKSTALGSSTFFRGGHFMEDHLAALFADTTGSTEARVFDRAGNLVLTIGPVANHAPHELTPDRWAFELSEGEGFAVFELRQRRRLATHPLRLTERGGPASPPRPHLALVTPTFGGGLTALHTRRQAGDVALYADKPAVAPRLVHPPLCPP